MRFVQLVHWKEAEARERVRALRAMGLRVAHELDAAAAIRAVREEQPDAVLLDLTRLPSHGREVGWMLRQGKKTRTIPLVFVGGLPEKVERVRRELPDAVFTDWEDVESALQRALSSRPRDPVVPSHEPKPLARKLGIGPDAVVALLDAPEGFEQALGELPEGATVRTDLRAKADLLLWFQRSVKDYQRALPKLAKAAQRGARVWVGWPKKSSGFETDLTDRIVREAAGEHDLVDYNICRLDETWTGTCLGRRRAGGRGASTS